MSPATPSVEALVAATASGSIASASVGAATSGAQPPAGTCATTRVPCAGPLPSGAVRSTRAGDVLARPPALARRLEEEELAAVDRVGLDDHEASSAPALGLWHLAQRDAARGVGGGVRTPACWPRVADYDVADRDRD